MWRTALRSIGAFLASVLAVVVLSVATDMVCVAVGLFPPIGQPNADSRLLALAFAYRLVFGVLGGYIIARLAPVAPMGHAMVAGAIGTLVASAGAVAMWNHGPNWYPVALAVTALPSSWLGGGIAVRHVRRA